MNDLVASPFADRSNAVTDTAGARQDQSRELAEMQVTYLMAQQFPRDQVKAMDRILNAFTRTTLAEKSQYQFSRGGTDIRGPSIRAMEAIAAEWCNVDSAWRERSRGVGPNGIPFSEVEAVAVDLQSRTRKRIAFIVPHWRDTKKGGYVLKDERDIYELCANQAQRRVRACLEAVIPGDVVDAAMAQADATLKSKADTSPEAMAKMVEAFAQFGVTKEHIEKRIQRRLEAITAAQVVSLKRIYASLRDEMSEASEWFEIDDSRPGPTGNDRTEPTSKTPPLCSSEEFEKKSPGWRKQIIEKKKTVDELVAMIETRTKLSEEQKKQIDEWSHEND
ncbi:MULTISPECIES: hypothetical protein [unclassified Paraburkholderia]|uniref:hypothetical protein n=1 Tax=unclassified Paraburkholderia TaxID=2615204 RepID=UPI0017DE07A4|nr:MULTISPECIES: hypothetical protein [unclassified Paraburkholderia]MBB5443260.1 hypothetical protein [Paraburkholderia sp. WSM4177]MBB5483134.1 hypothetical protein [Paraburkholderia sp. WSM4180]